MPSWQQESKIRQVDIYTIDTSPFQARAQFNAQDLESLTQSIKENGILQPLSVRRLQGGRCQLIAGERRLRAAKLAGLQRVPCVFCAASDLDSMVLGLTENLQRQNLNCFEEAAAMKKLVALWGCTQAQAAAKLGIAQPTLANKLRLLTLSEAQQAFCIAASLTERHARAVLRIEDEATRQRILEKVAGSGLTVAKTEELVEATLEKKRQPALRKIKKGAIGDLRLFTNTLNKAIHIMNQAGLAATATRSEKENCIEYIVRIPVAKPG